MKLSRIPQREFDLPFVPGYLENLYLNRQETRLIVGLVRSVKAETMIEFGCQAGRTARAVLYSVLTLKHYIGVDVMPDHVPTLECQKTEVPVVAGLYAKGDPRFELMLRKHGSLDLRAEELPVCDVAFIDGDHSVGVVSYDSALAAAIVRPGGLIVWHDYNNPYVEVTQVLDGLHEAGWPIFWIGGTMLAYTPVN